MKNFESPNFPIMRPGRHALGVASEAMMADEEHQRWHEDHPMEPCPERFMNMNTYADIERGDDLMRFGGGGTVEPGDALIGKGRK